MRPAGMLFCGGAALAGLARGVLWACPAFFIMPAQSRRDARTYPRGVRKRLGAPVRADEGRQHRLHGQRGVHLRAAVSIAVHLALAVGAQAREVQPGKVNALFAARAQDAHVCSPVASTSPGAAQPSGA